ncbi:hypothetical protein A1O7_08524 [Cladophialophora yegresii CBS 114405]|uniref:mRNA stability protein n=1 Tax=Cladophialophora yegresii CBS 114405 TaxID=1182544 RepID=W9VTV2_9EURO|nr:uncharacterized protein A1O7_08524 [Cladophialophora yegresii CBS 114405]EXJ55596.1 hypothetical protein A1O7_08524 [Cladophialophora yegresii CBS 114405]
MNPHQKNKIDINKLSADEQRLFRLYGKLPNKKDLLQNKLKERKYFDSGDYALSKAGKASDTGVTTIGTEHPQADSIPHLSPLTHTVSRSDSIAPGTPGVGSHGNSPENTNPLSFGQGGPPGGIHRGSINGIPGGGLPGAPLTSRSPVKESSFLARSASMDENDGKGADGQPGSLDGSVSPPVQKVGIPIRR